MLLVAAGCGKKAGEAGSTPQTEIAPMAAEVDFKAKKELQRAIKENDLRGLKAVLLYHPEIDLNAEFVDDGNTPLISAIKNDSLSIRDYLIDKKVNLNKPNFIKETPLIAAVSSLRINSVRTLIENRVDLNKKDDSGDTALHKSIRMQGDDKLSKSQRKNAEEMAIALIKAGANVEITDQENKNAFRLSQDYPNERIMELIHSIMNVELGTPDIATFRSVLMNGDIKSLNLILARFPRLPVNYEAINPLALALENTDQSSSLKMVQILLGYHVHVDGPTDADTTPLIQSVVKSSFNLTMILLQSKANTILMDRNGKSALYHAIEGNKPEAVQYLLNYSAPTSYTVKSRNGNTVSFSACSLAKSQEKSMSLAEDKANVAKIKKSLSCSTWWPF